ncbi:hypothetical protein [Haloechinothrix sp. LS1_15]|uniref:hypothetical protein n=1 Tax=Haloechinothrix sp. LS1_15 TaxID=2652248 RepID=UPI002943F9E6|nr:hypothetical protein [Haloechinothrix sp. LS1_15]MDV6013085.1 hypothetical protein [Haloechinothrix sp. LS1_15]
MRGDHQSMESEELRRIGDELAEVASALRYAAEHGGRGYASVDHFSAVAEARDAAARILERSDALGDALRGASEVTEQLSAALTGTADGGESIESAAWHALRQHDEEMT